MPNINIVLPQLEDLLRVLSLHNENKVVPKDIQVRITAISTKRSDQVPCPVPPIDVNVRNVVKTVHLYRVLLSYSSTPTAVQRRLTLWKWLSFLIACLWLV